MMISPQNKLIDEISNGPYCMKECARTRNPWKISKNDCRECLPRWRCR